MNNRGVFTYIWVELLVAIVGGLAVAGIVAVLGGDSTVAADDNGDDPWMPGAARETPDELGDLLDDIANAADGSAGNADGQDLAVNAARQGGLDGVVAPRTPGGVGIYGGSGRQACDLGALTEFLGSNAVEAAAFADVLGVEVADIGGYLDSLQSGFLLTAFTVTNHGFKDGRPVARPGTVLAAGTAVLVDANGIPKVRCRCGNPLLPHTDASPVGTADPGDGEGPSSDREVEVVQQYPDEVVLEPSITEEPSAYPLGLPPALRLRFGEAVPLSETEIEEAQVITSGVRRPVTLEFIDGPEAGKTFDLGEVIVPTGWRQEDLDTGDVTSWTNIKARSSETDFIPLQTPVADIRYVDGVTYAGFEVDSVGTFELTFPFKGDGSGNMQGVGLELHWQGESKCVVVNDSPAENFDPYANCSDSSNGMYWDWGINTITFN